MGKYLLRRILQMIPVVLGTTLLVYALVFALPGDPVKAMFGDKPVNEAVAAQIRRQTQVGILGRSTSAVAGNLLAGGLIKAFGIEIGEVLVLGGQWVVAHRVRLVELVVEAEQMAGLVRRGPAQLWDVVSVSRGKHEGNRVDQWNSAGPGRNAKNSA